jgi:peptidoglycan/LPS O-acetylase OafA/YrhL
MASAATISKTAAEQASGGVRYTELDALRGVAAVTVIFHHFRLMWFGYVGTPLWWEKPISPFTAGHQAVMLFFLLSGFVLSLPFLRGKGQAYPAYLARRVLRIYGPYFFALVLAVSGAAIWHGRLAQGPWADMTWSQPLRLRLVLAHVLMIGNYDDLQYNTAFWSLITEMRVSIVFPLMFWLVNRMRAWAALCVALFGTMATAVAIQRYPGSTLTLQTFLYAMIFVCGIVLAKNIERVNAWYRGLRPWLRMSLVPASILLYTWGPRLGAFERRPDGQDQILITIGAAGYMVLALNAGWAKRVLGTGVARFLGRISYSLYLVHGTVLFALASALGHRVSVATQFILFVGISIGLSYLFCIGVEEQFLRLSRMLGKRRVVLPDGPGARGAVTS